MIKCANCGNTIPNNARFCPECGCKVETIHTCPKCGNKVSESDKFCMQCGTILTPSQSPACNVENSPLTISPKTQYTPKEESVVVKCPKCGKIVKEDTEECPDCRYKFSHTYRGPITQRTLCPSCGATISDMNRICPECGCILSSKTINKTSQSNFIATSTSNSDNSENKQRHNVILIIVIVVILIISGIIFSFIRQNQANTPYIQQEEIPSSNDAVNNNSMTVPFDDADINDENTEEETESQNGGDIDTE